MFLLGRAETGKGVIVWLGPVSRETFFLGTRHWRQFMLISACVETAVVAIFSVSWPRGLLECCSGRHGGIANVIVRGHVSCYWWLASLAAPLHQEPPAWVDLPFFFLSGVRRVCPWQWGRSAVPLVGANGSVRDARWVPRGGAAHMLAGE